MSIKSLIAGPLGARKQSPGAGWRAPMPQGRRRFAGAGNVVLLMLPLLLLLLLAKYTCTWLPYAQKRNGPSKH